LLTIFLFFINFHCPQPFYCPWCSGVPASRSQTYTRSTCFV